MREIHNIPATISSNSVPITSLYLLGFTLAGIALAIFSTVLFRRLGAQSIQ